MTESYYHSVIRSTVSVQITIAKLKQTLQEVGPAIAEGPRDAVSQLLRNCTKSHNWMTMKVTQSLL